MAGCLTLSFYFVALLLTLLMPMALTNIAAYAPIQIISGLLCWLTPMGIFYGFRLGRRVFINQCPELMDFPIESKKTEPLTKSQIVVLVWLAVDIFLLLIWMSVATLSGYAQGEIAWLLALLFGCVAMLTAVISYLLGAYPLSDRRKVVIIIGGLFSIIFGIPFLYTLLTKWQEDPLVGWGTVTGAFIGLLIVYYSHRNWDPASLETVYQTRTERYFDVLLLTNGCFRFLFYASLAGGVMLMDTFLGKQFTFMVLAGSMSIVCGYMIVQVWRHRPLPYNDLP